MKKTVMILLTLLTIISCGSSDSEDSESTATSLNGIPVSTWMYQIQNLEETSHIDNLYHTEYDMLVVEPGFNLKDSPYDTPYLVTRLKQKPNGDRRLLLAYIDIGEAEDYRTYWHESWEAPTANHPGSPAFLITIDPDGWSGNYPVAYWDPSWKNIWLNSTGIIRQLVNYGFDGVYLDWVEAYDDDTVRQYADARNINPEAAMMAFIGQIRETARKINPHFLIVVQNAPYLLDHNPGLYASIIDAVAFEDTWFYGEGDAGWHSPRAGDLRGGERHADDYSTENRINQNKKYLALGKPVFTVDYCISSQNAASVYLAARENGFIPLVTRVSLSEITLTPPF
jgi:cysteinyl-tRNA synthetase